MRNFFKRSFDCSYFILAPAVLLTYFVPIRMRVGNFMVAPFLGIWLLWIMVKREKGPMLLTRKFVLAFVPLCLYYLLHAFLYGYHEWCALTLQKTTLDALLILIYIYIMHYSLARGKYRELIFLNAIICFALMYGSIAYHGIEIGSYRGHGGRETFEQTLDRLDMASSGVANYGCIYGMVLITVGMVRYLKYSPRKWWLLFLPVLMVFVSGIYRAAFSTATMVTIVASGFVLFLNLIKVRGTKVHRFLIPFTVIFVLLVAFPSVLSPFAGLFNSLEELFPVESDYAIRLGSIADALQGYKDTYAMQRAERYWGSLRTFCENPIFGIRFYQILFDEKFYAFVGGHSYFFDSFATSGLILPTLLIIGIYNFHKYLKALYAYFGIDTQMTSVWMCPLWTMIIVACINQLSHFEAHIIFYFMIPSIPFINYKYNFRKNGNERFGPIV